MKGHFLSEMIQNLIDGLHFVSHLLVLYPKISTLFKNDVCILDSNNFHLIMLINCYVCITVYIRGGFNM